MSSQYNHKYRPNNVTNRMSSLFSILSNFRQNKIIAKFSDATVLPFFYLIERKAIQIYTESAIYS